MAFYDFVLKDYHYDWSQIWFVVIFGSLWDKLVYLENGSKDFDCAFNPTVLKYAKTVGLGWMF